VDIPRNSGEEIAMARFDAAAGGSAEEAVRDIVLGETSAQVEDGNNAGGHNDVEKTWKETP